MRKIGFLLIAIAIVIGLLLPWAQLNFEGDRVAELDFANFNQAGQGEGTVLLTKADNPIRIRFHARYKIAGLLPPVKIPVQVKLSDKDGTLVGAIISFPTNGIDAGTEQSKVRSGTNLDVTIQNDGLHKLQIEFASNKNDNGISMPDVENITATFVANSSAVNETLQIPALILALLGFYLVVRSKRRGNAPPKKRRWGRGR